MTDVPMRVSFNHVGVPCVPPESQLVAAPANGRVMNSSEPLGRTSKITSAAPAVVAERSITPAFAKVLVFCRLLTRTTICASPGMGCSTD